MERAPAAFIALVNHQVVEAAGEAGDQGEHEENYRGFKQWMTPSFQANSINGSSRFFLRALAAGRTVHEQCADFSPGVAHHAVQPGYGAADGGPGFLAARTGR